MRANEHERSMRHSTMEYEIAISGSAGGVSDAHLSGSGPEPSTGWGDWRRARSACSWMRRSSSTMGRRSSTPITSTPRRSALFLATTHSRRSKRRRRACATRCGGSPGPSDLTWHLRGLPQPGNLEQDLADVPFDASFFLEIKSCKEI